MNLCKQNLNSSESLELIPSCEKSTVSDATNVLGLSWQQFQDKTNVKGFEEVTTSGVVAKCDFLHSVAKTFDPLGLVSPVTLHGKVFLQKLWINCQCIVDEPLPMELIKEWKQVS